MLHQKSFCNFILTYCWRHHYIMCPTQQSQLETRILTKFLSFWRQLSQPVTKISWKWWYFLFSVGVRLVKKIACLFVTEHDYIMLDSWKKILELHPEFSKRHKNIFAVSITSVHLGDASIVAINFHQLLARYRLTSDISQTKFPNSNVSRLVLPNPLKPCVKSRMKM